MKMFKRISALALVLVLVCSMSVSAFASSLFDYQDSYSFGDPDNSGVVVFADVNQRSASGTVEMQTPDTFGNEIYIYIHYGYCLDGDPSAVTYNYSSKEESNVLDCTLTVNLGSAYVFSQASYTFDVSCELYTGTHTRSFYSGVIYYS